MSHEKWMQLALTEAEKARRAGELPIGCILVSGNKIIARGQTQVGRQRSPVAHGETMMLLKAKSKIFTSSSPLVLYTTLEPCLMCVGAAINCGVSEVVYGMKALPDGAGKHKHKGIKINGGILEAKCIAAFRRWKASPKHPATKYYLQVLKGYLSKI